MQPTDTTKFRYFCRRCKSTFTPMLLKSVDIPTEKIVKFSDKFTGRFLTCGHSVNIQDNPTSYGEDSKIDLDNGSSSIPDPEELRTINMTTTMEFSKMSQEQKENFIEFHVAQHKFHLRASKKEKYIVQLVEDLILKQINDMKMDTEQEQQLKRNQEIRFGYFFRRPEKRLEIIAKEKVRADSKIKKDNDSLTDALAKMKAMMSRSGLDSSKL